MTTDIAKNEKIAESMKGNQNAKKGKIFYDELHKFFTQNPHKKREIVENLVEAAVNNEAWAVKEVIDRMDGKAVQATTFEDADGNNLLQAIEVRFVKPSE